jgi:hypothetical protein
MIKIKKTKSVEMSFEPNTQEVFVLVINTSGVRNQVQIPMSKIFQVQRGLTSAIQKFYRKK